MLILSLNTCALNINQPMLIKPPISPQIKIIFFILFIVLSFKFCPKLNYHDDFLIILSGDFAEKPDYHTKA